MKELFFETIDSTNTFLKKHYEEYEDMTFVGAAYQSAGRGRSERQWLSLKGQNLMFSLLIKDQDVMKEFKALSVIAAYSVLEVMKGYGMEDLSIKWPNDVYVKDEKICGILLEGVSMDEMKCLIIGIGINVNQTTFEGDYLHAPTSMKKVLGENVDLDLFREKIYQGLNDNIAKLKRGHDFYPEIVPYDYLKGKSAYARIDGVNKAIDIIGIDADYSLKILDAGDERNISSSEITFHI